MNWYDWHTITERLQGRIYALTRGRPYKVVLDPATSTGCCNFTDQKILINPNLFSDVFQKMGISGNSLDKANFLVSRAITGHEALHVLYSDPEVVVQACESANLKIVLNLLEDARVERIGAMSSHVSKTLFRFVNGIAVNQLSEFTDTSLSDKLSGISLLLRWRLGAGIPQLESKALKLWNQIHGLAEKALYAETCADVLQLAREILQLLDLDKADASTLPDDIRDVAERMQSDVIGPRSSSTLPNPLLPKSEQDENDSSAGEADDLCKMEEPTEDVGKEDDAENAPSQQDDSTLTSDDDISGQSGVSGGNSPTIDSFEDSSDNADESNDGIVHSQPDHVHSQDIEKLIEETALQVCEDLDSLTPEDTPTSSLVAEAKAYRGRKYSDIVASPYIHYLPQVIPIATELTRELKAEGPRALCGASECAGRFRTRYFIRDSAKPFAAQRFVGMTTPEMALSLVIDRSGSMEDVEDDLRIMSMAIAMACENLQIPLSIWALEGQVHIKHFDEHGPQVLAKIAGIKAETLTRTAPTLRDALADLKLRPETLKQIVMIHDGLPGDQADFIKWRSELQGIGLFCLFIMKDEDYESYQQDPQQMREHMDSLVGPRNYAIAPVTGIAKHWCSFIRNKRNSHSSINY